MTTSPRYKTEAVPDGVKGPGVLHLHCALPLVRDKVVNHLQSSNWEHTANGATLSIRTPHDDLTSLVLPLTEVLSAWEQVEVRALFEPDGRGMQLNDYFAVDSLKNFLAKTLSGWLIDLMQNNRLTTVFQPIVHCKSSDKVFAYECLLRSMEQGEVIYPNRILDLARGAGLLFQLDMAARRTAIREAAAHGLTSKIFINFTPIAMADPVYGLRSTVEAVDELGLKREQVVFEVIESELIADVGNLRGILDEYRSCGFGVALDDLGSGYSSLNLLGQLRPDYVKLDRQLMHCVHEDGYKALIAQKLLETAQGLGIRTIAEGIECQSELDWLCYCGGDYAQ
ncbi:MAG: EAL domain-containing protein, partial [Abitibacteriaceae bacterium]|nr:EAL domain-containing protein [Abditibacteriaceae bacterium]